jgi:hypothetical protein
MCPSMGLRVDGKRRFHDRHIAARLYSRQAILRERGLATWLYQLSLHACRVRSSGTVKIAANIQ